MTVEVSYTTDQVTKHALAKPFLHDSLTYLFIIRI